MKDNCQIMNILYCQDVNGEYFTSNIPVDKFLMQYTVTTMSMSMVWTMLP